MDKKRLLKLIKTTIKSEDLYSPIVVDNKIYFQHKKRSLKNNIKKMKLFPDMSGESIVDIGSNTGFSLFYLKEHRNTGMSLGLEFDRNLLEISEMLVKEYGYEDTLFSFFDVNNELFMKELPDFDNILFLSVSSLYTKHYEVDFHDVISKIVKKAKKRVFIEPTNHEGFEPEKYKSLYTNYFKSFGEVEYLGNTIYQNRGLFQITKK